MDASLAVSVAAIFLSNLVVACQVVLLRRQVYAQAQASRTEKWNRVSELEISNSVYHKLLMNIDTLEATRGMAESELRERAFAHIVFDICSEQYKVSLQAGNKLGTSTYLADILTNPRLGAYCSKYRLRDAWSADPFQEHVDSLWKEAERRQQSYRSVQMKAETS